MRRRQYPSNVDVIALHAFNSSDKNAQDLTLLLDLRRSDEGLVSASSVCEVVFTLNSTQLCLVVRSLFSFSLSLICSIHI